MNKIIQFLIIILLFELKAVTGIYWYLDGPSVLYIESVSANSPPVASKPPVFSTFGYFSFRTCFNFKISSLLGRIIFPLPPRFPISQFSSRWIGISSVADLVHGPKYGLVDRKWLQELFTCSNFSISFNSSLVNTFFFVLKNFIFVKKMHCIEFALPEVNSFFWILFPTSQNMSLISVRLNNMDRVKRTLTKHFWITPLFWWLMSYQPTRI